MKRILVTGAGGAAALSFSRSLRENTKGFNYYLVGLDAHKYKLFRAEVDKRYWCPRADSKYFIPFLKHIIEKEEIDFLHAQPEIEVYTIGKHRDEILETGCKLYLPSQEVIERLRNKARTAEIWRNAGIKIPKSMLINDMHDLKKAYADIGDDIWIREITGAGGKGALSRPEYIMAKAHINACNGWGRFMAAEHLTDRTITWQSIWQNGDLIVGQGRRRRYWEFASRTQSGVTGITGTGTTVSDKYLDELAVECIKAVDDKPHGIYSVDLTFDWDGIPNPTEINIGKFFTTHHFLTRAGCNMPEILIQLAFDEYEGDIYRFNPCAPGLYWIRGMDKRPVLIGEGALSDVERTHVEIMGELLGDIQ